MGIKGSIETPQALGRAIQQARALRGMSQRDLASQLGISQRWLWELEKGKPGIFTDRLFEVLRAVQAHLMVEIDSIEIDDPGPTPSSGPGE
ncbi:MAG: helix-turn-helix domain-containing protein [Demequinaceae bacterium]|nr:helix-turn-helix domain-containing protein [Demequinaceae bacterium]